MVRPTRTPRTCGSCTACCTASAIDPLDKPAHTPCSRQTQTGCGDYDHRPGVCREIECMWLADDGSVLADHHRPDRLGVYFTVLPPDPRTRRHTVIEAHEVFPGVAETPEPRFVIEHLQCYAPVHLIPAPVETVPLTRAGVALM